VGREEKVGPRPPSSGGAAAPERGWLAPLHPALPPPPRALRLGSRRFQSQRLGTLSPERRGVRGEGGEGGGRWAPARAWRCPREGEGRMVGAPADSAQPSAALRICHSPASPLPPSSASPLRPLGRPGETRRVKCECE